MITALALLALLAFPGAGAAREAPLRLLVAGDSMVQPLAGQVGRGLDPAKVKLTKDPRPGTGISRPLVLDWPKHAARQTRRLKPDAVVIFIGAADWEPLPSEDGPEVECCGAAWIDAYAARVEQMMRNYLARKAHVYWLTLPAPREPDWAQRFNAVNQAFVAAAEEAGKRVRIVDTIPALTPGNRYRRALHRGGKRRVVRDRDGIHLNRAGARIVRGLVLRAMRADGLFR